MQHKKKGPTGRVTWPPLPAPRRPAKNGATGPAGPARNPFPLAAWALAVLLVLAYGLAGRLDAEEADRAAEEYCANVHAGLWPDYDGTYRAQCVNGKPRPVTPPLARLV